MAVDGGSGVDGSAAVIPAKDRVFVVVVDVCGFEYAAIFNPSALLIDWIFKLWRVLNIPYLNQHVPYL